MEKNCGKTCEDCPIRREWIEQVDEANYDITFLGAAVMESQRNNDRALKAYVEIAGEAAFLVKDENWKRFKEAEKKMDYDPAPFRQLASELLDQLQEEADGLDEEITEVAESCEGPITAEFKTKLAKYILTWCDSPEFLRTDGIEPVHVQRIPLDPNDSAS